MRTYKNDQRFERTEKLIWNTFLDLVLEKGFNQVHVQDIIQVSGLSRSGFYLHYEDKYHLLQDIEDNIITILQDMLINGSGENSPSDSAGKDSIHSNDINSYYENLLQFMYSHQNWMNALFTLEGEYSFRKKLMNLFQENTDNRRYPINELLQKKVPEKYWISYCVHASLGVIETWLKDGCRESPKELANIIVYLMEENKFFIH